MNAAFSGDWYYQKLMFASSASSMKNTSPALLEAQRLARLDAYGILDTPQENAFDDIVKLLSQLLEAPIAAVNLLAADRQWFKAEIGLGVREMPLDNSICKFALLQEDQMVVPDTLADARFDCNPLVTGEPGLRFYAGELLKTPDGIPIGTLCVLDVKPRPDGLTPQQDFALRTLAQQIMDQIELRKVLRQQHDMLAEQEQIRKELQLERDQSQRLLEGMDEGFIFLDQDFRIMQINNGGLKFEIRPASEMIGRSHWEVWPGSENLPLAQHYKRAMKERVAVNFEENYIFPDGRSYWLDTRAYPANNGLAVFYRDITDRKESEARLRHTAERLEFTLQAAQIGDWDLDLLNDTAYRSLRHDQCFGYSEPVENWGFETFIQHIHPEDRDFVAQQFQNSLNNFQDWHFECRVVWPDQSVHWIAAHGSIYEMNAKPARMAGIVYEITGRKVAEEALRESQHLALDVARQAESERRRLDALLEAVPVGIIVADANGALVHFNAENQRLWGRHPMSSSLNEYADWKGWWADGSERHGQRLEPHEWSMARALAGEDSPRQIIEIEPFDASPKRRIVLNSGAPIRDETGRIVGAVVAQMDITDRIRAEEALREADQKKDEFLAMLAHELRNPLAPISSAAEILALARFDESRILQTSAIIARQVKHMTGLIDDLLDVSRVTRGKISLEKTKVDAKDVIADAIEQVRPLVEKHNHRMTVQLSPEPTLTFGDRKRLVQVFTNLLSNAAKYTPDGGRIEVCLETEADDLVISVIDNGIGMTADLLQSAFELFSQGKRGLDRSQGGLGIGLALVKSLVQFHDGTVTAYSDGPHTGSRMVVRLPHTRSRDLVSQALVTEQENSKPTALRIAVVDDNEDAAATLSMFFEACGHEVLVTHSALDALKEFPAFAPHVCMLDIGLPEIDGFELARRLRQAQWKVDSVFIAITGYGQERDRQEAIAAGFDELFAKPVDLKMLNAILTQIAQHRPRFLHPAESKGI
jgi:PAS domain S-box-containing protein